VDGAQLGFEFETARLVKLTPARLSCWADCPRRYRLTYVEKPAPARGGPRAASTLGAVVHLALRALFDLPAPRRTRAAVAALVDRNWSSEGFRDAAQAAQYRDRAREWVADYAEGLDPDADPVGREQWVSVATGRIVAEGRVDRIDRRGAELVVVDYKSGRHVPSEQDAATSPALALYALATERTLRRRCVQVELHHLPTGGVSAWRHDRESLGAHVRRAESAADEFADATDALGRGGDQDTLFPPRPAPRCGGCDVRRHCPEGRAAAPESVPWADLVP
jgi:putative RecB family exonuclease